MARAAAAADAGQSVDRGEVVGVEPVAGTEQEHDQHQRGEIGGQGRHAGPRMRNSRTFILDPPAGPVRLGFPQGQ